MSRGSKMVTQLNVRVDEELPLLNTPVIFKRTLDTDNWGDQPFSYPVTIEPPKKQPRKHVKHVRWCDQENVAPLSVQLGAEQSTSYTPRYHTQPQSQYQQCFEQCQCGMPKTLQTLKQLENDARLYQPRLTQQVLDATNLLKLESSALLSELSNERMKNMFMTQQLDAQKTVLLQLQSSVLQTAEEERQLLASLQLAGGEAGDEQLFDLSALCAEAWPEDGSAP